ncbi:conserved hypothetical protein [Vibrio chagasii]|nr:conserved hypothetical protein [Vibrio chagasii]
MRMIRVDGNRDPILRNGRFEFVYGIDAVAQVCDHTVRTQLGEYRYNKKKGIEYMNNVFLGDPNFQVFEIQVKEQLELVDGVNSVTLFEYEQGEETLNYTVNIDTIFGETSLNGNL